MTPSLVSVVMSVHNGARYVRAALDSALGQDGVDVEMIVVDDGSDDETPDILTDLGDRVVTWRQTRAGIGPARNRGIELASGALLSFLDADDLLPPGSLQVRVAALAADASLEAVFGHARQFFSPELTPEDRARVRLESVLPAANVGGMVIRRAAWDRVGPFAPFGTGQGVDWMIRAREAGLVSRTLDDIVLDRRVHGANHGRSDARDARLHVLKAALDRRRAATST